MQELWHRPIVLMMVLAGVYFAVRTNRVFSQICITIQTYPFCSTAAASRCAAPMPQAY